jgi:acid phosphatase (class A)
MRLLTVAILALSLTGPALADTTFASRASVDLVRVLPPPPSEGSDAQKRDLQAVLDAQAKRSPEQTAQKESDLTVFNQFASVLGSGFSAQNLPKTAVFFGHGYDDAIDILGAAKAKWKRPRPFLASPEVHPAGERPKSASYPSGNSLLGYLYAILLADILPEKRDAIFAKGLDIGDARVVAGVHYPTDVAAGRLAAVEIVNALTRSPAYRAEFEAAKAELRAFAGL